MSLRGVRREVIEGDEANSSYSAPSDEVASARQRSIPKLGLRNDMFTRSFIGN